MAAKASAQAIGTYLSLAASQRIGCGQAPDFLQIVVGPALELGNGVLGEELRRARLSGNFPRRGLGAVLAKLERL